MPKNDCKPCIPFFKSLVNHSMTLTYALKTIVNHVLPFYKLLKLIVNHSMQQTYA